MTELTPSPRAPTLSLRTPTLSLRAPTFSLRTPTFSLRTPTFSLRTPNREKVASLKTRVENSAKRPSLGWVRTMTEGSGGDGGAEVYSGLAHVGAGLGA